MAQPAVADKVLKFHELSTSKFKSFHDKVFVERSALISATIHKYNLLPINFVMQLKSSDSKEVKISKKEIKEANFA